MFARLSRLLSRLLVAGPLLAAAPVAANEPAAGTGIAPPTRTTPGHFPDPLAYAAQKRMENLRPIIGVDPATHCMTANDAFAHGMRIELTENIARLHNFTGHAADPLSPQQATLARAFYDFAKSSTAGGFYARLAMQGDTVICGMDRSANGNAGAYLPGVNTITLVLKHRFPNEEGVCQTIDLGAPTPANRIALRHTLGEEIVHRVQSIEGVDTIQQKSQVEYHRGYKILHELLTEAQAKVRNAMIAADEIMGGDYQRILHGSEVGYERKALQDVLTLYSVHGRDAVMRDAGLLFPVVQGILEDEEFLDSYFLGQTEQYSENHSNHQPAYTDFVTTFDSIPGMEGRLIGDRFKGFRDLIGAWKNSYAKRLLLGQFPQNPRQTPRRPLPVSPQGPAPQCE